MDYEVQVKWIKLLVATFEDEKIKLIETMPEADKILVIWIKLLAKAGKINDNGYIYLAKHIPYTNEMLVPILNRPLEIITLALETLEKFGMIRFTNSGIMQIVNWSKHQNTGALDKIRENNRERQKRYRDSHQEVPAPDKPPKKPAKRKPDESQQRKDRFEEIYKLYPNRDSKVKAKEHFNASVKTEKDWQDINTALTKYKKHLAKETWRKPKSASTWFNSWIDWVDYVEPSKTKEGGKWHAYS